jgi:hypothetical protein
LLKHRFETKSLQRAQMTKSKESMKYFLLPIVSSYSVFKAIFRFLLVSWALY